MTTQPADELRRTLKLPRYTFLLGEVLDNEVFAQHLVYNALDGEMVWLDEPLREAVALLTSDTNWSLVPQLQSSAFLLQSIPNRHVKYGDLLSNISQCVTATDPLLLAATAFSRYGAFDAGDINYIFVDVRHKAEIEFFARLRGNKDDILTIITGSLVLTPPTDAGRVLWLSISDHTKRIDQLRIDLGEH